MQKYFMVFDVESVGLHGEGFAVGYVVIESPSGKEIDSGFFRTTAEAAIGQVSSLRWVQENVVPALADDMLARDWSDGLGSKSPKEVREKFWQRWEYWRTQGAMLAADCAWPVEARFLIACVDGDRMGRDCNGPYPLIDIASVRLAAELDPLGTEERLDREKPVHHPLADARQSARLLVESLTLLRQRDPLIP
jgi:hypothetical protein